MSATSAVKKRKASSGSNNDTRSTSPAPTTPSHVYAVTSLETDSDGTTRKLEALYTDVANANEAARRIHNKGDGRLGVIQAEEMDHTAPEEKRIEAEGVELKTLPDQYSEIYIVRGAVFRPRLRSDGGMRFGGTTGYGRAWVVWVEPLGLNLPLPVEEETEVQDEPAYAYEDEEEEEEEDLYEDMDRPWH